MSAVNLETEGQLLESVSPPTLRYDDDANIMNDATVEVAAADDGGGADDDVADDDGAKSGEMGFVSVSLPNPCQHTTNKSQ